MKLTYRGHAYDLSTPSQINSAPPSSAPVKLIYRGQTYYAMPRPALPEAVSAVGAAVGAVVTLIYRGATYQRVMPGLQSYRPAGVINWRYQVD